MNDPLFSLEGRAALVTGGGRGIGRSMASALASRGVDLVVVDINGDSARATASDIRQRGVRTIGMEVDVTDRDQALGAVSQAVAEFGRLDILVNNAGIGIPGLAATLSLEDFRRIYEVDVLGVFNVAQAAYPTMAAQKRGVIINLASVASTDVLVDQEHAAYNSAKAAVAMLTKAQAVEWASAGIRVNAIAPGFIVTELMAVARDADPLRWTRWMEHVPMGRAGEMSELDGALIYLASDASAYVTGSMLVVDGGYVLL